MRKSRRTATLFSILAVFALLLSSCSKSEEGPTFTVKGNIANGDGKNIAVYHIEADEIKEMGTARIGKDGNYRLSIPAPGHFDFYLMDIEKSGTIVFIADSTETITISGDANEFIAGYTVDGNPENQRIKEITMLRSALEKQAQAMANSTSPAVGKTEREIRSLVNEFKENIIRQYIMPAPGSASAYYALTLTIGNMPIFSPMTSRDDSKCFAAVATNFQLLHPETSHTRNLTRITEKALNATRPPREVKLEVEESEALTTGLFDIRLPKPDGDSISLSSLAGKVVLLDFTAYENSDLSKRNITLREIHSKYRQRGFEVFQVSVDRHEHFWQQSAANLPWVCVRDARCASTNLFNVQALPTFFLISREGEILLRDAQIDDIEKEIEKLLKN